jgi:hypothetical protein
MMTKEEMIAGLSIGRALIQEEWSEAAEIRWIDELVAEGKATATPWEYRDSYQCEMRRITGIPNDAQLSTVRVDTDSQGDTEDTR